MNAESPKLVLLWGGLNRSIGIHDYFITFIYFPSSDSLMSITMWFRGAHEVLGWNTTPCHARFLLVVFRPQWPWYLPRILHINGNSRILKWRYCTLLYHIRPSFGGYIRYRLSIKSPGVATKVPGRPAVAPMRAALHTLFYDLGQAAWCCTSSGHTQTVLLGLYSVFKHKTYKII